MDYRVPKVCKNEYSHAKSWKNYWLGLPIIVVSSIPHSPHVSEQYLEWITKRDAEARKVICANLISIQSRKEDDLSQNGKKRVMDPTPEKTSPPGCEEVKKGLGF